MATQQFPSPRIISEYIHREMTSLLHANNVYRLDSYGWIDAETHDPALVGHAMRQTDSLAFRLLVGDHPPPLSPWQKFLIIAAEDFEGLLEATRLSIGLMLFQSDIVGERPDTFDTSLISVHLMSSMFFLGAASDRLRDVFVAAVSNKTTTEYHHGKYNKQKRSWYKTPFIEAIEYLQSRPFSDSIAKLPPLTETIHTFRDMRNEIVHVIATELAQRGKELVNNPPSAHDDETVELHWEPTEAIITESLKQAEKEAETEHRNRISRPIRWYQLLIEASNHVFIIENMLRNRAEFPYHHL
jgi:hypothetical protein